jgi:hypothetical protein
MDKKLFKDSKIREATFSFIFTPIPEIEKLANDFHNGLKNIFERPFNFTKVPDNARIDVPRFILNSKNKRQLEVSLIQAHFKIVPDALNLTDAQKLFEEKAKTVFDYMMSNKAVVLEELKAKFEVNYPLVDLQYPIQEDILKQFFTFKRPDDFEAVSFKVMQRIDDLVIENTVDSYEVRRLDMQEIKSNFQGVSENEQVIYSIPRRKFDIVEKGLVNKIIVGISNVNTNNESIRTTFNTVLQLLADKATNYSEVFIFS